MSNPDYLATFADIVAKWNAIEQRLKEAEQICGDAVVAAINELRYAGRQFVDAMMIYLKGDLSAEQQVSIEKHLNHVQYNLMNADHDCTDAVCLYFHERVKRIQKEYGFELIVKYLPEYQELFDRMDGANKEIARSREDRQNRLVIYRTLADFHIPRLYEFDQKILTCEPLMLAYKRKTRLKRNVWMATSIVFALVIVALIIVIRSMR
jgi:uncharacterized protein YdcH (DUF465 family)